MPFGLLRWPKKQAEAPSSDCNNRENGLFKGIPIMIEVCLMHGSIHNTERNLDLASNQNRLAAEKAREIKTLNVSCVVMLHYKWLC
jgi:hypothetical protein